MSKSLKVIIIVLASIIGAVILAAAALFLLMQWGAKQPAVQPDYFEKTVTEMPLERKYTAKGGFEISSAVYLADNEKIGQFKVWYPTELESGDNTYPLVIMANGTGVKASRYEAVFEHLASWGFIVVGNEDESSWDGVSSSESLDLMLKMNKNSTSIFFGKVDFDNIGVAGHSQGGVGAINAVTAQENGSCYKALYTASATHIVLSDTLGWHYDVSQVGIPYFMTAGTLQADAGDGIEGSTNVGIAPLFSLQENYSAIPDSSHKVMARRTNADHGDMLYLADGYMTAWFMYWLKGDEEAGEVFFGDNAEILNNSNWQDTVISFE
ncbi:MAG: alpha/beta hydrolase [Oscillospiraceae bacterium]